MKVDKSCTLTNADWFFFNVYGSEFCKEDYDTLDTMSLSEFMKLEQYVAVREALKAAHYKDEELNNKGK